MREIKISLEEGSNRVVVRVMDSDTAELIREIPADEMQGVMEKLIDSHKNLVDDGR